MTFRGEQDLGDMIADGTITEDDAHAMRMFSLFLRESNRRPAVQDPHDPWSIRWGPYIRGEADGPTGEAL